MKLTITIFNVLLVPFISIYLLHKNDCDGFKVSSKIIIEYFVIMCVTAVAAKATAIFIANIFIIVVFHYEPTYSIFALAWTLIITFLFKTVSQNFVAFKDHT